jgi:beta-lactamase class A
MDSVLAARLRPLVTGFAGRVGIYVRHLGSGATVEIDADSLFPTASMIKVPILVGVFDRMERGELAFLDTLVYTDSLLYPGEDILGSYRDSAAIPLAQVLMLMITTSDNTAALWAQHLAGTGTHINAWLDAHGFAHTRVNSRTPGREDDRERYGWGQTTPREMAELLVLIRDGRAVSAAASEAMYRHLTRIYWTGEALSQIPPWVQAASKQGAVNRSRSEAVLVNAPSGDYVFCVITKEQEDESWEHDNEGFVLLRRISAILWDHFEPAHPWRPAEGVERYLP